MNKQGVRRESILISLAEAQSLNVLEFLGDCLRVHKQLSMPHTLDEQFMDSCRAVYCRRKAELEQEVSSPSGE